MPLDHPLINRSWLTYQIDKHGDVRTILHVETKGEIGPKTLAESELAKVVREYMEKHTDIDRADVEPLIR
jgi:hypothetical protein